MFRIVCDPTSGSIELYSTEIRSSSLMFVVCLVGVWQRNFEPVVCPARRTVHTQWRTQKFCSGGVQQIQFRTEDRENGDLGAVAP